MSNDHDIDGEASSHQEADYLDLRSAVRPYSAEALGDVFSDMRANTTAKLETDPEALARNFAAAARSLGSHLPKLLSSRVEGRAIPPLTFNSGTGNAPPPMFYSGDAKYSSYAKVLLRPIAIEGREGTAHFVQRLIEGDEATPALRDAFKVAFGEGALLAVEEGLRGRARADEVRTLRHADFPVFFAPGPEGDLQLTPLPRADALDAMRLLRRARIDASNAAREAGDAAPPPGGQWIQTVISGKMRNVALRLDGRQTRFLVRLPSIPDARARAIYRWALHDGPFPRVADARLGVLLLEYAEGHEAAEAGAYSNPDIRAGRDRRADRLLDEVASFREETLALAEEGHPGVTLPVAPTLRTILMSARLDPASRAGGLERARQDVRRALQSEPFERRIAARRGEA